MDSIAHDVEAISRDAYDSPWKEAVEHYFPEFMAFFFPAAHAGIDWQREHRFLDQELREVTRDAELGTRHLDKLVGVVLRGGEEQWVYVHVEVQGSRESGFAERMFVYNYRIYDRYRRPVASLAILADDDAGWRPRCFGYRLFGCRVGIRYPTAKLADHEGDLGRLLEDPNPFALVTAAHLLTRRTRNDLAGRYEAKLRLVRLLYARGWERQRVIDLFAILDWMMHLPDRLNEQLQAEIAAIEERDKMRYVTSIERLALKRGREEGLEEGMEKGREEGLEEGRTQGQAALLTELLGFRFGPLPEAVRSRLAGATEAELTAWGRSLLKAESLEAVFKP